MKYLVSVIRTGEVEVEFEHAFDYAKRELELDMDGMTCEQIVEAAVAHAAGGEFMPIEFEQSVICLTRLIEPPPGYTAEELERDNPYNQWLHEDSQTA